MARKQKDAGAEDNAAIDSAGDPMNVDPVAAELAAMGLAPDQEGGEPSPEEKPAKAKVKFGSREFEVDPSLADPLNGLYGAFSATLDEIKASIRPREEQRPVEAEDDDPLKDIETEIFQNPRAALEKAMKVAEDRTTKKLTGAYQADAAKRNEEAFWKGFYEEHDDLERKTDHTIVGVVLNENLESLKSLDADTLSVKLAELTREKILSLTRRQKPNSRARAESADIASAGGGEARDAAPNVVSLSATLNERKRLRREKSRPRTGAA